MTESTRNLEFEASTEEIERLSKLMEEMSGQDTDQEEVITQDAKDVA